jgi:hypothetical protein
LACAAVKGPGYGSRRKAMLQDIAILTNGRLILLLTEATLTEVPEKEAPERTPSFEEA